MNKKVLSVLVDNTSGVLNRVAGLFSRRGYNIDSLTVGVTQDPRYSRMTIVVTGDDDIIEQIIKQIEKLVDVNKVEVLEDNNSVCRELILTKVKTTPETRQNQKRALSIDFAFIKVLVAGLCVIAAMSFFYLSERAQFMKQKAVLSMQRHSLIRCR